LWKKGFWLIVIAIASILVVSLVPGSMPGGASWALLATLIVSLAITAFFWRFEKSTNSSLEVALIATMAALAAVSRVPFAIISGLQPTTFIVMITGYVFGAQTGFVVGAVAGLVSNFFLGQGPWTPWQMFAWGMCGVAASILAGMQREFRLAAFTLLGGLCGFLFGWIMNFWHWAAFVFPLTWKTFLATYAASFPFDTLHAAGNILFSVLFGKRFYLVLNRFKKKALWHPLPSQNPDEK